MFLFKIQILLLPASNGEKFRTATLSGPALSPVVPTKYPGATQVNKEQEQKGNSIEPTRTPRSVLLPSLRGNKH